MSFVAPSSLVPSLSLSPPTPLAPTASSPLFGLPGGPELVVLLLLFVLILGVPALVFVLVYRFVAGRTNYEERISQLEREVASLQRTVAEMEASPDRAPDDAEESPDTASEE